MKTLARERDRAEIAGRLRRLHGESVRRWGRMSVHQAVCHLNDSLLMALGEIHVSPTGSLLQRTLLKWIALYMPVGWPAGVLTSPEIDQHGGGTRPRDFDADFARLEILFDRVCAARQSPAWPPHPVFGRMSRTAWLRWGYLHMDHHLRQFGA